MPPCDWVRRSDGVESGWTETYLTLLTVVLPFRDMLRAAVTTGSEMGKAAKSVMDAGGRALRDFRVAVAAACTYLLSPLLQSSRMTSSSALSPRTSNGPTVPRASCSMASRVRSPRPRR